jgi:hypothetical protein
VIPTIRPCALAVRSGHVRTKVRFGTESPSSCTHDLHRWRLCGFAGRESTLLSAVPARTQGCRVGRANDRTRIQALLEVDLAADDTVGEPWLAELYMDGVANRIRTGPRSGQRTSMADANEGLVTDQEPPPAVLRSKTPGIPVQVCRATTVGSRAAAGNIRRKTCLSDENALAERPDARRDGADRTD